MSVESVNARIAEIQARIQGLSAPQVASDVPIGQGTAGQADKVAGNLQPFNVALETALGTAGIRPAGREFNPHVEALISKYSALHGLAPDLVRAVIRAESDGDPRSISRKGAKGLMQLMPDELKTYGVSDPFDPEQSIAAGVRQLAGKLQMFNGDIPLALAAYNAGSGAVRRYGGVPPYNETRNYVARIMNELGQTR